jgi:glycosyltransferase involved in cell wall biosynthesis
LKVIMVSSLAYPPYVGGVQSHVWEISKRLVKKGFDVEIYSTDPLGRLGRITEVDDIKIRRFPSFAPNGIYFLSRELYSALKNAHADIIHSHGYQGFPMLASALAKVQNGIPLIVTLHCGFRKVGRLPYLVYDSLFGRIIFHRSDRIIIVSPIEMELIGELLKVKEKIRLVPNGVDLKAISSYLTQMRERSSQSPVKLLFAGRLEKKKGLVFLVKAFREIAHRDVELSIVGDGPFKQKLVRLVRKLKLQDKVRVKERLTQAELYELYAESHIFVLPSEFEAHSIALTEAMAFGLVPVVTNVGGNRFLVLNEVDGFLLDYPPEIRELSNVLLQLVDNRELLRRMSKRAVREAQQFDIDRVVEHLGMMYQSIGRKD